MEHAWINVILISIVLRVKYVSVTEVANILVRKMAQLTKVAVQMVNIVIWIIRFVMTFVLVMSLVMTDINVTIKPVTNYVIHLAIVVMNNIVQGKFCTLKNMI